MNKPLRNCPTCGTNVRELDLGLRDFRWIASRMPGHVAPMDVDFMLERKGHVLVIEMKPENVGLPVGQKMTFRTLQKMGATVWVVQGDGPMVTVSEANKPGTKYTSTVENLAERIVDWYEWADGEEEAV